MPILTSQTVRYGNPGNKFYSQAQSVPQSIIYDISTSLVGTGGYLPNFNITQPGKYAVQVNINVQNSDVIDNSGNVGCIEWYINKLIVPAPPPPFVTQIDYTGHTVLASSLIKANQIQGALGPMDYTFTNIATFTEIGDYTFTLKGFSSVNNPTWNLSSILVRILKVD